MRSDTAMALMVEESPKGDRPKGPLIVGPTSGNLYFLCFLLFPSEALRLSVVIAILTGTREQ